MDPLIQAALEDLEPELDALALGTRLRQLLPTALARRAAEVHALRLRARGKLSFAEELELTARGLEQASHRAVAAHRAARFAEALAPDGWVLDATAGVGSDAMALLGALARQRGGRLLAGERDPDLARSLRHNLGVAARKLGEEGAQPATVLVHDAAAIPLAVDPRLLLVLVDPDRRTGAAGPRSARGGGGVRTGDPMLWSPSWDVVVSLLLLARGGCAKLAPATDVERLDLPDDLPQRFEWISLRGELKEVSLWSGVLAGEGHAGERVATLLRPGASEGDPTSIASVRGIPTQAPALSEEEAARVPFLFDPDPGLIRSGLLGRVALDLGLAPLDPHIAYLGGGVLPGSPRSPDAQGASLLRPHRVIATSPLDRRQVRALLRTHGIGPLTVKKRGHPDSAETLAKRFRGKGERRGTLVVARIGERHLAYLVEPGGIPGTEIVSG